jgi:hypothetical protein
MKPAKMKTIIFTLLIGLFISGIQAQETEENTRQVLELDELGLLTKGIVTPMNGESTPVISEYLSSNPDLLFFYGIPEQGNTSVIYQEGDYNQAELNQAGNSNNFGLLQKGDNNQYDGTLNGDENLIRVLQLGNGNNVLQDLEGNGMQLDVIQEGNNHEVIQIEKDGSSPAYQIHQRGEHGMQITIEHLPSN